MLPARAAERLGLPQMLLVEPLPRCDVLKPPTRFVLGRQDYARRARYLEVCQVLVRL